MTINDILAIPANVSYIHTLTGLDASVFAALNDLTTLDFLNCTGISGDLNFLGLFPSFNNFLGSIDGNYSMTMETFVANKRSIGIIESTGLGVAFPWASPNGNITFNGSPIAHELTNYLTWTSNTITYKGVTINA